MVVKFLKEDFLDIDECANNYCVNGECENFDGGVRCDCSGTGYEGDRCELGNTVYIAAWK